MAISLTTRISVPADVLVQELQGESVILNVNSGRYFGLDEVGSRMWQALTTSPSIQAAHEVLLGEYDVDAEVLRRDFHDFVEKLVEQGLLEASSE
jgi:hypothetical protein